MKELKSFLERELAASREFMVAAFDAVDDVRSIGRLVVLTIGKKQASSSIDNLAASLGSFAL